MGSRCLGKLSVVCSLRHLYTYVCKRQLDGMKSIGFQHCFYSQESNQNTPYAHTASEPCNLGKNFRWVVSPRYMSYIALIYSLGPQNSLTVHSAGGQDAAWSWGAADQGSGVRPRIPCYLYTGNWVLHTL